MAMDDGFDGNANGNLHDFFAHKIRQNLHFALLMNTEHPQFGTRILANPALYKHCNIVRQKSGACADICAFNIRGSWHLGISEQEVKIFEVF
jgi:hypothetical protein